MPKICEAAEQKRSDSIGADSSPGTGCVTNIDASVVSDLLTQQDLFEQIIQYVEPTQRCRARGVCKVWRDSIDAGGGVPLQLKVPFLMGPSARRHFLSSQEFRYASALDLSRVISDSDLEAIAPSEGVTALDLSRNAGLGANTCSVVLQKFPNLKFLSLDGAGPRLLERMADLISCGSGLKSIMLSSQWNSAVWDIHDYLKSYGTELEALCISTLTGPRRRGGPSAELMRLPDTVAKSCPNLERLSLSNYPFLTEESLAEILERCPKLLELHIAPDYLELDFVRHRASQHPTLEKLVVASQRLACEWRKFFEESEAANRHALISCEPSVRKLAGADSILVTGGARTGAWAEAEMQRYR